MTRDYGNLLAGLVLAAFGVYVISVAIKLPYVSEVGPGPGFFPLWLGIGLLLFSCALAFSSLTASRDQAANEARSWTTVRRSLAGWLAVMATAALLGRLGFFVSFVVLTVFLVAVLDRRPLLVALGVGAGLAVAFHLIFVVALDVSLPKAVWGF
jgi:putative tricarboxylic transport membrane protein